MINIGTSGISDISIGNTSVSKVYFGNETNPVWQKVTEVPTTLTVNNTSGDVLAATLYIYKIDTTQTVINLNGTQVASSTTSGTQNISVSIPTGENTIEISGGEWYFDDSGSSTGSFHSCIKSVIFGTNYGSIIGRYAFSSTSLTSVTIPSSVTSIDNYAFYNCTSLTSVTIPSSVTSIGIAAFSKCNALTSVFISDLAAWCDISFGADSANPLVYAHNLYLGNNLITSLIIPNGVTKIKNYAFYGCTSITSVSLSNSMISLGGYCFRKCTNLATITIPDTITTMGSGAFTDCSALTGVYLWSPTNAGVYNIMTSWANIDFSTYTSNPLVFAKHLYVNNTLVTNDLCILSSEVKNYAFYNCIDITFATFTYSGAVSIGTYAFYGCYNLQYVETSSNTSFSAIGRDAFALTNLSTLPYKLYSCQSLGKECFATRNNWLIEAPSGTTSLDGDTILNRLVATNNDSNPSAGGYTGAGYAYIVRARYNVHKSGGDAGTDGGSFNCFCNLTNVTLIKATGGGDATTSANSHTILNASGLSVGASVLGKTYCIITSTAPTLDFQAGMGGQPSNYSSHSSGTTNNTLVAGGTLDWDCYTAVVTTCLVKGTLITLADGTKKPVEDITYDDLLLVYNFETGTYDYQYPTLLSKGNLSLVTRITLEDDSYIEISGVHDLYDPVRHEFVTWGNGMFDPDSAVTYHLWKEVDGELKIMKVKSQEYIERETECYACMTGGTLTAFANDILVGSVLLNFAGISQEDKFYPKFQEDKKNAVSYEYFEKNIYDKANKYLTMSLNLQYLDFYYNPDTVDFDGLYAPFINSSIKPPKQGDKIVCNIAYIEGEKVTVEKHLEDEEITLPQITEKGKTKWYVVGEYKYLNAGDKLKVNFSTTIRAV